jgi:hypothetical protein
MLEGVLERLGFTYTAFGEVCGEALGGHGNSARGSEDERKSLHGDDGEVVEIIMGIILEVQVQEVF